MRISDWSSDVCSSDLHAGGGEIHRADPAATKTIECRATRLGVKARRQRRHAAEVAALLAVLRRGRPDDVVDRRGVEIIAVADRCENGCGEELGGEARKSAVPGLAYPAWGEDGAGYKVFGHGNFLS